MGDSVSATKPETSTAPANASANSVNSRPVRPGVNASGAYTAASVSVMAMTAKPTSRAPRIDASNGFYRGHAEKESRSFMNVTFKLPSEELEKTFVAEALAQGLGGVKGHRSVGGMRASIYNAMTYEGVDKLASFMEDFQKTHA